MQQGWLLRSPALRCLFLVLVTSGVAQAIPWMVLYDQQAFTDPAGQPPPAFGVNTYSLRAVALSNDDAFLYTGWLHQNQARGVYRHDALTGAILSTYNLHTIQANCLATDDRNYVYIGYGAGTGGNGNMEIRNATLATQIAAPFKNGSTTALVEGVSLWDDGLGAYYLYLTRDDGTIERWNVSNASAPALDTTWATNGVYTVLGAGHLRGLRVDSDGTIFVTQRDTSGTDRAGFVYRIDPLLNQTAASLAGPMDVAILGNELYISQYLGLDSAIVIVDKSSLSYVSALTPDIRPATDLYGYAGIDISGGGQIYLADQWYDALGAAPPTWVRDRVLVSAAIPEPATWSLLALGGLALARRRSRARTNRAAPPR